MKPRLVSWRVARRRENISVNGNPKLSESDNRDRTIQSRARALVPSSSTLKDPRYKRFKNGGAREQVQPVQNNGRRHG